MKPKVSNAKFGIRHYAGEVYYDTTGLLNKNRDTFRDDILGVLKDSKYACVFSPSIYLFMGRNVVDELIET